jgi:hypothetical protein
VESLSAALPGRTIPAVLEENAETVRTRSDVDQLVWSRPPAASTCRVSATEGQVATYDGASRRRPRSHLSDRALTLAVSHSSQIVGQTLPLHSRQSGRHAMRRTARNSSAIGYLERARSQLSGWKANVRCRLNATRRGPEKSSPHWGTGSPGPNARWCFETVL